MELLPAYRLILENHPSSVLLLDDRGTLLTLNHAALALLEADSPDALENQSLLPCVSDAHRAGLQRLVDAVYHGEAGVMEFELIGLRGAHRWVELHAGLLRDDDAGLLAVFGVLHDLTESRRKLEELRASEELHRLLAENSNDLITLRELDGRHVYSSPSFARILGQPPACGLELILERFHPDDREMGRRAWHEVVAGSPRYTTFRYQHANGSWLWLEAWGTRVQHRGKPHILSVSRDITQRKHAEEKLRESEALYRFLTENTHDIITLYDQTERRVYVSPSVTRVLGYTPGKTFEGIHPDDVGRVRATWKRILKGEKTFVTFRHRHADGSWRWLEASGASVHYHGAPHVIAVSRDVTGHRTAQDELLRREEHFRLLIENASDLIIVVNHEGVIRFESPSAESVFGRPRSEMLDHNALEFLHPDDKEETIAALRKAIASPMTPVSVEHRARHQNGRWRTLHTICRSIPDRTAEGFIVLNSRDITDSRVLQEQLRHAQKMDAIGQLAGGVAHDFNNILAAIMMQAELVTLDSQVPPEVGEALQMIRGAAERGANLTRQLLQFGRRQTMQPREVNLNEIVTSLSRMLQRIIGEDVRLKLELQPAPLIIRADAGMLDQVLLNLAVNARDAMPRGGSLLIQTSEVLVDAAQARLHPDTTAGHYACLSVSDNGTGIAPDVLPRIFEPFFTTKEQGKGTGLGLATVFGIVRQHRGWIDVDTEIGRGTKFTIFLPALPTQHTTHKHTQSRPKIRGGNETILLAEDDDGVRLLTRAVLEQGGYRVLEAATGAEVIDLLGQQGTRVDLLLTDLIMPGGMSGYETARRLQHDRPQLEVVFVSGYGAEIAGREVELRPGHNFLQKPFTPDDLLQTVRRALDRAAAASA